MKLILASASPRRAKILASAGFDFTVLKTDAPEVAHPDDPERTVVENAVAKLRAAQAVAATAPIIAADTIVWHSGCIYGKPRDLAEAAEFLRSLAGRTHTVFTGVAIAMPDGGLSTDCVRSDVTFHPLDEAKIAEYIARVRPLDRAGAYDIDESGDLIVASYTGSYENIMGLPLEPILKRLGPATRL